MKRLLSLLLLLPLLAIAAPFAEWIDVPVPGGGTVAIWGEGDEYDAYFETKGGHALRVNDAAGRYEYVTLDEATKAYAGTGVFLGDEAGNEALLASIPLHLRDESEAHAVAVQGRIDALEERLHTQENWERVRDETERRNEILAQIEAGTYDGPMPTSVTRGTIVGVTILLDFPVVDDSGTPTNSLLATKSPDITTSVLDAWFNRAEPYGTSGYSVRRFYEISSEGQLQYTNVVIGPFTVPHPRDYYDNGNQSYGTSAREMIGDVLDVIKADPRFQTEILPLIRLSSVDSSGYGKALNVIYAGPKSPTWSVGLWPHRSTLYSSQSSKLTWQNAEGRTCRFYNYNIVEAGNSPNSISTTLHHENGHMVCDFPDLYNSKSSQTYGAGDLSLMGYHGRSDIDPYLRAGAGWYTPKDLPEAGWVTVTGARSDVWKFRNPSRSNEYFLIENRRRKEMNQGLGGDGIVIWRCYGGGRNFSATQLSQYNAGHPATNRWSNELSVEQADGLYHFERHYSSYCSSDDFWHSGNSAALYTGVFDDDTAACSRWYDGTRSGLRLSHFSKSADTMTFFVGDPATWPEPFVEITPKSAAGETVTFTVLVESWGSGCSSADVYAETGSDAAFTTTLSSTKIGTMSQLNRSVDWSVTGLALGTPHFVRLRIRNAAGEFAGPVTTLYNRIDGDIAAAVDAPTVVFVHPSGNPKDWFVTTDEHQYGSSCARSGGITHSELSILSANVTGPGSLSFHWKVSSENNYDFLRFARSWNGTTNSISGTVGWTQVSVDVPAGSQTVSWIYRKDGSASSGSDCGWLDHVVWTPDVEPPALGTVSVSATTTSVTLSVPVASLGGDATSATVSATLGGTTKTATVSVAGGTATLVFEGLSPDSSYAWTVVATSVPGGVPSDPASGTARTAALPATGWFDVRWSSQGWESGAAWRTSAGEAAAGGRWTAPAGDASSRSGSILTLGLPEGAELRFMATEPSAGGGFVTVDGTLAPVLSAAPPNAPAGAIAGLCFARGSYRAWNGSSWVALSGAAPSAASTAWVATFDFGSSPPKVRYAVGGATLAASGSEWIALATPRRYLQGVGYVGGGSIGDFKATYAGGFSVPLLSTLADGGHVPLAFGKDSSNNPTFEVTIKNAVKDAWYTVYAADTVDGTYMAVTSVKATAPGLKTLAIPAPSSKPTRFVRIGVSDTQVPTNTEL